MAPLTLAASGDYTLGFDDVRRERRLQTENGEWSNWITSTGQREDGEGKYREVEAALANLKSNVHELKRVLAERFIELDTDQLSAASWREYWEYDVSPRPRSRRSRTGVHRSGNGGQAAS